MSNNRNPGADVVVVGGGMVGLCSALALQQRGYTVTVVDHSAPGNGASGHNAGIFSIGNCLPTATPGVIRSVPKMLLDPSSGVAIRWRYLPRLTPWLIRFLAAGRPGRVEIASLAIAGLLKQAIAAYSEIMPLPDTVAGPFAGDHLLAYGSDATFKEAAHGLSVRRERGIAMEILDAAGVAVRFPSLANRIRHGVLITGSYFADPRALVTAVAQRFTASGGHWLQRRARAFRIVGTRVVSIETDSGRVHASRVVIAAGAWSRPLVRALGFDTPLDSERGYGVRIANPGIELEAPLIYADRRLGITPVPDGVLLAGTDELAGLSAPPDYARADMLIEAAKELFPRLRTERVRKWMSFRPSHPDSLPVIGLSPRQDNAYLAYGHGHIGFTTAAITGKLIGQLVDGEDTTVDLKPFSPTRFRMLGPRGRWVPS